eukprot:superscaffoldBa00007357_g22458
MFLAVSGNVKSTHGGYLEIHLEDKELNSSSVISLEHMWSSSLSTAVRHPAVSCFPAEDTEREAACGSAGPLKGHFTIREMNRCGLEGREESWIYYKMLKDE